MRDRSVGTERAQYFAANSRPTIDRIMREIFNPVLFGLLGVMYANIPLLLPLGMATLGLDKYVGRHNPTVWIG